MSGQEEFFQDLYLECNEIHINRGRLTGTYKIWKHIFGSISYYRPKKIAIFQKLSRLIGIPFQIRNRHFAEHEKIILEDDVSRLQRCIIKSQNFEAANAIILKKSAEFGSPNCFRQALINHGEIEFDVILPVFEGGDNHTNMYRVC